MKLNNNSTMLKAVAIRASFGNEVIKPQDMVERASAIYGQQSAVTKLFLEKTFSSPTDIQLSAIANSTAFYNLIAERSIIGELQRLFDVKTLPLKSHLATSLDFAPSVVIPQAQPTTVLSSSEDIGFELERLKLGGLFVMPDRVLKQDFFGLEEMLNTGLISSLVAGENTAFINMLKATATPQVSTGNSLSQIVSDLIATGADLTNSVLLLNPATALQLGAALNTDSLGVNGGEIKGLKVVTSNQVSATDKILIPINSLVIAQDPEVAIELSREANVTVNSEVVNLWQTNRVCLQAIEYTGFNMLNPATVIEG